MGKIHLKNYKQRGSSLKKNYSHGVYQKIHGWKIRLCQHDTGLLYVGIRHEKSARSGVLPMMAYTLRLRQKGVPVSCFRYMKDYERVGMGREICH